MVKRSTLTYENLVDQGRRLLEQDDPHGAHEEFRYWDRNVADWLDVHRAGTGASAEWSSLEGSNLVLRGSVLRDPESLSAFRRAVRSRLGWLAGFPTPGKADEAAPSRERVPTGKRVFLVHGHDKGTRETVARFLEKLKLEVVVLHEQPDRGRTIIEKFTDHADVSFAVVLLTGDDVGGPKGTPAHELKARARQNVIFELGFFLGKRGRDRVCALYEDGVDIPSDYQGVLFVPLHGEWRLRLTRELKVAGLPVDAGAIV